ncbi:phage baseplate assembly protein W [Azospirillum lipoferum]|uniref:GPW/gp25 family protein n=1 Tax=Azospirillum lipoferum TaxID=193 RepID=A0A5A9GEA7_AZOLI|nr:MULTISPECIES: GPW/gp25 family protein [Azospirillum]KAA0592741.1 GPW/gp25 family protein [Azospirillum lipoferum]MCP1614311.1 phage baseplate assembly protein W [Azospirillum lipoferum]MDW5531908.1 GPW/gp25 family protein [Azospirillum sp. NL1]
MADDTEQDFLGTGWSFPPTFNRHSSSVVMSSDVQNIKESLWVLLSTSLGERLMLATYGTTLRDRVFDSLTETLINQIKSELMKAIVDWEPRIDVLSIAVQEEAPLQGLVTILIDFVVRSTNVRSNLVYPFYLTEATLPSPAL